MKFCSTLTIIAAMAAILPGAQAQSLYPVPPHVQVETFMVEMPVGPAHALTTALLQDRDTFSLQDFEAAAHAAGMTVAPTRAVQAFDLNTLPDERSSEAVLPPPSGVDGRIDLQTLRPHTLTLKTEVIAVPLDFGPDTVRIGFSVTQDQSRPFYNSDSRPAPSDLDTFRAVRTFHAGETQWIGDVRVSPEKVREVFARVTALP